MALDSEAYFASRLSAAGLTEKAIVEVQDAGWRTLDAYAFSSAYVPG